MASVNKAIIVGNVVRDPELKYTTGGKAVATFAVATNSKYNGEEHVEFHNVVAWEKQAELAASYLNKGRSVYIEGRLSTRSWEDEKVGKKMYRTEIIAQVIQFLGSGNNNPEAGELVGAGVNNSAEIPFN